MTAKDRGCYCDLWNRDPATLESRGVPRGFCGHCQTCGQPGHTRHFPGGVPFTGCWCDKHYRRLSWLHPLACPGMAIYVALFLALVAATLIFGA